MKTKKKTFVLSVDVTMAKLITINAESEEQAMAIVEEIFANNPYTYTSSFSHYLNHEITDIEEV